MRLSFTFLAGLLPLLTLFGILWWGYRTRIQTQKSPFTSYLLRPPGESLRLRVETLDETLSDCLLFLICCCIWVGFGVWSWFENVILGGLFLTTGLVAYFFLARRFVAKIKLRRNCYLGFLGERAVGEELNSLLAHGWRVFHDVEFDENPGAKPFNVDHVVIGPGGIYAIETKTRRKRVVKAKEDPANVVTFDGTFLEYPWGKETLGVHQARERAAYVSKWLTAKLQTPCPVIAVLALPGWSVTRKASGDLRVVSGREICSVFRGEHTKSLIDQLLVQAIAALLDQKCRDVGL